MTEAPTPHRPAPADPHRAIRHAADRPLREEWRDAAVLVVLAIGALATCAVVIGSAPPAA